MQKEEYDKNNISFMTRAMEHYNEISKEYWMETLDNNRRYYQNMYDISYSIWQKLLSDGKFIITDG